MSTSADALLSDRLARAADAGVYALVVGTLLGLFAFLLACSGRNWGNRAAAAFGVLALPLGLPAVVYARRLRQ